MSTIHSNASFTLDGLNNFNVGSDTFVWSTGWVESIDVWSDDPGSAYTVTVSLTGSNWAVGALRFGNDAAVALAVNVNDSASGANRFIDFMRLGATSSTVHLTHTGVGSIVGGGPGTNNITTGTEWVGSILVFEGNDTVNIGSGGSESVTVGRGTNTVTTSTGWAGAITGYEGNDTVHVGSGGASAVNLGNGNNRVTTAGIVDAIFAYHGNDTAVIGAGGFVGSVNLGHGNNTVTVLSSADYVQSITGYSGIDIVNIASGVVVSSVDVGHGNNRVTTAGSFVNSIVALNGNDVVTLGTGGAGWVSLGRGNDFYNLGANGGVAISDSGGIDTITSTVNRDLALTPTIENLTLLGAAINGFGNALNNRITGNAFSNKLVGHTGNDIVIGGAGNDTIYGGGGIDTLTGGANSDFFVFNAPLSAANRDVITDFNHALDTFRLENAVMTKVGAAGALNSNAFFAGAAAHDASDRIIYNKVSGNLFYDSNGNAAGGVTHLATLTNKPVLAANDFVVI